MKQTFLAIMICALPFTFSFAHAASDLTGCAAKKHEIEQQIEFARKHNALSRISGLEKALNEVTEHCTDSDLLQQRQAKVAEKQMKVREREQELAQAQASGRPGKIEKRQQKLDDARQELAEAEQALSL